MASTTAKKGLQGNMGTHARGIPWDRVVLAMRPRVIKLSDAAVAVGDGNQLDLVVGVDDNLCSPTTPDDNRVTPIMVQNRQRHVQVTLAVVVKIARAAQSDPRVNH